MTAREQVIRIAVFNCGYTNPVIQRERGQYHEIFLALLNTAAKRISSKTLLLEVKLSVTGWDTVKEEYPPSLDNYDVIIISGSPNSAYQEIQWIKKLNSYISDVYKYKPHVKLYGSCFGHQIICQALLAKDGAIVEKSPMGWELGVQSIDLSPKFTLQFSALRASRLLRLQSLHGDHVIIQPGTLPSEFIMVGSTANCPVQGIYQAGRILTYQGHPEFDRFINTECLKLVGKRVGWEAEFIASALLSADADDDASVAADIMVSFFLESTTAQ